MGNKTFIVYSGFVCADNYDCSDGPIHEVNIFNTHEEVIEFHKEFQENVYDECGHVIFRVFEGTEMKIAPVEFVKTYELQAR